MPVCKKCNKSFSQDMNFCGFCGKELESEENKTLETSGGENSGAGAQRTVLLIALVAIITAFSLIVGALLVVAISSEKPDYALFVQDGDLVYVGVNQKDPVVISEGFEKILDLYGIGTSEYIGKLITVTRDRQHIIYVKGISDKGGYSLYVKSLRDPERSDVKISSSVFDYVTSPDGETVIYLEYDTDLYRYEIDSENKERLGTEVERYIVSDDAKHVLHIPAGEHDDELFIDGEQFDVNIGDVEHYSSDLSFFVYSKRGLYTVKNFGESQLITEENAVVYALTDDGAFYYSVPNGEKRELYYCDKSKNELVTENFYSFVSSSDENPCAVIKEKVGENITYRILYEENSYELDVTQPDNLSFIFTEDGRGLYYIEKAEAESAVGTLWLADISRSGGVKSKEQIDTDVNIKTLERYNDSIIYFKDVSESGEGDMYIDGELVDYEAILARVDENHGNVYYYTNKDSDSGTLKLYSGNKSVKIGENVYAFDLSFEGEVFYLSEYRTDRQEGDLYLYKNGKRILIENEVRTLIKVYNRD